jgi:integrase
VKKALPRTEREERQTVGVEAIGAFLAAAAENRLYAYWCVLLFGGLRPSEALALRWEDIRGDTAVAPAEALYPLGVLSRPAGEGPRPRVWRKDPTARLPPTYGSAWIRRVAGAHQPSRARRLPGESPIWHARSRLRRQAR